MGYGVETELSRKAALPGSEAKALSHQSKVTIGPPIHSLENLQMAL